MKKILALHQVVEWMQDKAFPELFGACEMYLMPVSVAIDENFVLLVLLAGIGYRNC